ncbi:hypothetical protein RF11_10922 [Thelohanellus kitauei]|uniref:Uncharacterized protein n=1 Tax=Thelohanellus kitauei TaxID=669202 RepID=A0A0C2MWJ3_THEKT|nr:hypothetical protein RF11_10922 [Thelohanellus kitauei]
MRSFLRIAKKIEQPISILTFVSVYGCFVVMEWYDNRSFIYFLDESKIVEEIYPDTEFESKNKIIYSIHDKMRVMTKICIINAILSRLLSHKIKSKRKRNILQIGSSSLLVTHVSRVTSTTNSRLLLQEPHIF